MKRKVGWIEILFLLAMGVTAHDFASYYGFHIPGLHAFDFSIPMMAILFSIMFGRRIAKWLKSRKTK